MGNGRCKFEFHCLVGKKSYSPTGVAFRSFRAGKGCQTGFKLAVKNNSTGRSLPFLTLQSHLNPVLDSSFFMCSMVREVTPGALAMLATVHAGPYGPVSQSNNARGVTNFFLPVFPLRIKVSSLARSDSINVILYLGAIAASFGCYDSISFLKNTKI